MSIFIELLRSGRELECELIIGDADMPATFVWDPTIGGVSLEVTDYCYNKYRPIMDAEYDELPNGNIEIHCDDWKLGEAFTMAAAGYTGVEEFEKLFGVTDWDV